MRLALHVRGDGSAVLVADLGAPVQVLLAKRARQGVLIGLGIAGQLFREEFRSVKRLSGGPMTSPKCGTSPMLTGVRPNGRHGVGSTVL